MRLTTATLTAMTVLCAVETAKAEKFYFDVSCTNDGIHHHTAVVYEPLSEAVTFDDTRLSCDTVCLSLRGPGDAGSVRNMRVTRYKVTPHGASPEEWTVLSSYGAPDSAEHGFFCWNGKWRDNYWVVRDAGCWRDEAMRVTEFRFTDAEGLDHRVRAIPHDMGPCVI